MSQCCILTGVLWNGAFIAWLGHLSRWKIDLFVWTDCKLGYFIYYFGTHYSSMLLAAMSIEKFFALYFPLKAKSYCTVGTAKRVTCILACVIAGLNVPSLIGFKYDRGCAITKHNYYIGMIHTILYLLVPFGFMLIANIAIISKLMYIKYKGISHTNESVSKSSTRGSVMVVTVSLAFIILTSPRAVDDAINFQLSSRPFGSLLVITMQYLNHSINGILYCTFGEKFRNELLKILSCCGKKIIKNRSTAMNSTTTDTITANSFNILKLKGDISDPLVDSMKTIVPHI